MSFITYYLIFSISTAVTSCCCFFIPRLISAINSGVENDLVDHPKLSCVIYTLVGCIISPILFAILVLPGAGKNYMDGLDAVLREEKF
jgi:hypothetical protein